MNPDPGNPGAPRRPTGQPEAGAVNPYLYNRPDRISGGEEPSEIPEMRMIGLWLCLAWLAGGAAFAQEPEESEEPKSVEERLDELDQKVRVLDRKSELDKEQAAEKAKTAGQVAAGKD